MERSDVVTLLLFVWGLSVAVIAGYQLGFNSGTDACMPDSDSIGIPA